MTALVDDRDAIRLQTLYGIGDEVADAVNRINFQTRGSELNENGSGGLYVLVGEQKPIFRLHDHHASTANTFELRDGAGQLALKSPSVIGALDEIGKAELALIENFKTHAVAAGQTFGRELHAETINLIGRDVDGAATVHDFIRHVLRLQLADDRGGVFF